MPGREHFIPQFFMRAWAGPEGRDRVYQFRRGRPGVHSGTRDTAVVSDFYGEGADSVDWMFTEREGDQATLVRDLLAGESAGDTKPQIDEFITLMTARSRNIRLVFSDFGKRAFDSIGATLNSNSEEVKTARMRLALKQVEREFAAKGLPPGLSQLGMVFATSQLRKFLDAGVVDQFYAAVRRHVDFDVMIKKAHVDALRRLSAEPAISRAGLAELRWRVEVAADLLVLGDAGPMARFGENDDLRPLYGGGPTVAAVFYPLSPRSVLVGAPDGSSVAIPSADELNVAVAESSSEFFIASQSTDREAGYAARIGLRPIALVDEEEMQRAMREGLASLE